jgi:magnesium transporter
MPNRIPKRMIRALRHIIAPPRRRSGGRARKIGLAPGTLVYTGVARDRPTTIAVTSYDSESLEELEAASVEDAVAARGRRETNWVDVVGLEDVDTIRDIGDRFGIDHLVLEDILSTGHRPKVALEEGYVLLVARMFQVDADASEVRSEQLSLVIGPDYLITFQEEAGDVFDPVRRRIRESVGRIRGWGPDYLAYALLDVLVDHYFVVLEHLSEAAEEVERIVLEAEGPDLVRAIYRLRRHNIALRRAVWPMREVTTELARGEIRFFKQRLNPFLRDVHEHAVEALDSVESQRDLFGGLLELHLTTVSNRMNEVMKVLAIIATIFVPLTFIAGIYGMNFEYMPELHQRWGYPALLALMFVIFLGMLVYFRRKRWF